MYKVADILVMVVVVVAVVVDILDSVVVGHYSRCRRCLTIAFVTYHPAYVLNPLILVLRLIG